MSDTGEQNALLADQADDSEQEDEQMSAMRQTMGFSSFGGPAKPKRQPRGPRDGTGFGTGANSQPIHPRTASTSTTLSANSNPFVPASLPPRPANQTPKQQSIQHNAPQSVHSVPDQAQPFPQFVDTSPSYHAGPSQQPSVDSSFDETAYTNPDTGISFTKRELAAYERGVVQHVTNDDGSISNVKVYFKPSFVEDNPWKELEVKAGLR